jgi:hypothetical protein
MSGPGLHVLGRQDHSIEHAAPGGQGEHGADCNSGTLGEIKTAAEKLEALAVAWDKSSETQIHQHHRWADYKNTSN